MQLQSVPNIRAGEEQALKRFTKCLESLVCKVAELYKPNLKWNNNILREYDTNDVKTKQTDKFILCIYRL